VETQSWLLSLGQISPALPFLVQLIVTGAAVLLAWAIFSIIAFWIYEVLSPPLERAVATLALVRASLVQRAAVWLGRRGAPVSEFVETHSQAMALSSDNAQLKDAIASSEYAVDSLPASIATIERSFNEARMDVDRGITSVERIQYPTALAAPSPEEFALVQVGANNAWLITIVFFFFSIMLISINTLMLNEFFATFFPPLKIGPVRLSIIGACLFSLLEFAGGAAIAFVEGDNASANRQRILLMAVIAALATIELGFYAKFGQSFGFNPFSDVFPEDTTVGLLFKSWFGIFGPAVVFILAWCGDKLFVGIRGLGRNRVAGQWGAYLRRRQKAADTLQARIAVIARSVEGLKKALHDLDRAFQEVDGDRGFSGKIEAAQRAFAAAIETAKAVRLGDVTPLGRSEMLRLYTTHLFLSVTCLLTASFLILLYSPLGIGTSYLFTNVDQPSSIVAALECAILLGSGYISTRAGNNTSSDVRSVTMSGWSKWPLIAFLCLLVGATLVANGFFLFNSAGPMAAMWFAFVTAASLWLFRCGQSLGLMIAADWAFFNCTVTVCVSLALWLLSVLVGIVALLLMFLKTLLLLLRFPYVRIFERKISKATAIVVQEQA
jgi:hypothetical protein